MKYSLRTKICGAGDIMSGRLVGEAYLANTNNEQKYFLKMVLSHVTNSTVMKKASYHWQC